MDSSTDWEPLLADELITRAESHRLKLEKASSADDSELRELVLARPPTTEEEEQRNGSEVSWAIDRDKCHLVVGSAAHQTELERTLREAKSYVALVSSFLSVTTITALLPLLNGALSRGVLVDVLWGQAPDPLYEKAHIAGLEFLRKLEDETVRSGISGKVNVARKPVESHAKILLSDGPGGVRACIGSFNWLGATTGAERGDVSLWVSDSAPVARVCHLLADFGIRDERLGTRSGAIRLRNFASDLSSATPNNAPSNSASTVTVGAQLIIDRQHEQFLRQAAQHATRRVVIASHRWQPRGCDQLMPLFSRVLEDHKVALELRYGVAEIDGEAVESFSEFLLKRGAQLVRDPNLHSKYVVADDDVAIISSYNWLNGRVYTRRLGVEVGVYLTGGAVGADLLAACGAIRPSLRKSRK
jgi:cardiolipin synthase A/B